MLNSCTQRKLDRWHRRRRCSSSFAFSFCHADKMDTLRDKLEVKVNGMADRRLARLDPPPGPALFFVLE